MESQQIIPQLYLGKNKYGQACWSLTHYEKDLTVVLEIRYHHGDEDGNPNHYTVLSAHEAEWRNIHSHGYREVITHEELQNRVETIEIHEGTKEAQRWLREDAADRFMVAGKYNRIHHIANQLKGRWEGMLNLGLFTPHITL